MPDWDNHAGYFEQQPVEQQADSALELSVATDFPAGCSHLSHASPQQLPSQAQLPGEQSTHWQFSQEHASPQQQVEADAVLVADAGFEIVA